MYRNFPVLDKAFVDDGYLWYRIMPSRDVRIFIESQNKDKFYYVGSSVYDIREDLYTLIALMFKCDSF